MPEKILARIKDPRNSTSTYGSKRSQLTEIFCSNPFDCDIYLGNKSCLMTTMYGQCKFASCANTAGPTPAHRAFVSTIQNWKTDNAEYIQAVNAAPNRIFRANGYYYLPYAFMAYSLKSKWVPEEEITIDFLANLCQTGIRGPEEFIKFLNDLYMYYPQLFVLLPNSAKTCFKEPNYVGRKADLSTCAPGTYVFNKNKWEWDGTLLHGTHTLFPPVQGKIAVTIKPLPGQSITITHNEQVTSHTKFLD